MSAEQTSRSYKKLAFLRTCQTYLLESKLNIPLSVLEEVVDGNDTLTEEWEDTYYDGESQKMGHLDTCLRDVLSNQISLKFVGMPWPTFGDGKEHYEKWKEKLECAMHEKGFLK